MIDHKNETFPTQEELLKNPEYKQNQWNMYMATSRFPRTKTKHGEASITAFRNTRPPFRFPGVYFNGAKVFTEDIFFTDAITLDMSNIELEVYKKYLYITHKDTQETYRIHIAWIYQEFYRELRDYICQETLDNPNFINDTANKILKKHIEEKKEIILSEDW